MVSSKCCQVESPSPFRFLAALIPPCAHTECERFTGTIENRSTLAPISAILMTAASPARPPPTTMILGIAILLHRPSVAGSRVACVHNVSGRPRRLLEPLPERVETDQTYDAQQHEQCQAHTQKPLLCLVAGDDAPLRGEQPDPVGEMPRGGDQPDNVERKQPGIVNFRLHLRKRSGWEVVQVNSGKAHR